MYIKILRMCLRFLICKLVATLIEFLLSKVTMSVITGINCTQQLTDSPSLSCDAICTISSVEKSRLPPVNSGSFIGGISGSFISIAQTPFTRIPSLQKYCCQVMITNKRITTVGNPPFVLLVLMPVHLSQQLGSLLW